MKKYLLAILLVLFSFTTAWSAYISYPRFQVFDTNGDPLVGGLVNTYVVGGVVAKTTYSDAAMTSANSNPVVLDSRGECSIYCSGTVKLVITTSAGVAVHTTATHRGIVTIILEDADGNTQIQVEESTDEDIIRFDIDGTEQIILSDGSITPTTDSDIDLGSTTLQFANIYANTVYGSVLGFVQRANFTWADGNTLTIGPGVYHHSGTTVQTVYWNSDITFNLGSDGSNTSSDGTQANLGSGIHYIYLDATAIDTQAVSLLDADCFLNETTAPTYSVAKHGWYNGLDRCISAVCSVGATMYEFVADGNYHEKGDTRGGGGVATTELTTSFADIATAFIVPSFVRKIEVEFQSTYVDATATLAIRPDGTSDSQGHNVGSVAAGSTLATVRATVMVDAAGEIEWKESDTSTNTYSARLVGWYLSNGI